MKKLNKRIQGATCICLLCTTAGALADSPQKKAPELEETVVIGEKVARSLRETTSSVSVLSEDELNGMKNITFTGAIAEVPNVLSLSGSLPDIRGVSGNGAAGGFNSISGGA